MDFQRIVDSFFLNEKIDIYITGSNAYLLSGELVTLLSRRYITVEMLPLSFKEFAYVQNPSLSLSEKYRLYVEQSSFPYTLNFDGDKNEILDYLDGVYSAIVLKDVVSRYKISDTKMLESVVRFIFDSIGSPVSTKKNCRHNGFVWKENRLEDNRKIHLGFARLLHCLRCKTLRRERQAVS